MRWALGYATALLLVSALFYCPGYAVERWLLRTNDLGALRSVVRWTLGLACWMASLFVLATIQQLHGPSVVALSAVAVVCAVAAWFRHGDRRVRITRDAAIAGIFAIALLLPIYFQALRRAPTGSDMLTYHLTLPKLYLEHGGFRNVPILMYANWPLNTQLLYVLPQLFRDSVLATLIHFLFGALTLHAFHCAAKTTGNRWATAVLAMVFLTANSTVLSELRKAYVDLALLYFFFVAFLFVDRALERRDEPHWLPLAGVASGVAAGIKPNGIVVAVVLAIVYAAGLRRELRARGVVFLRSFALPVMALWGPWLMKSWWYTGNPIYPLGYSVFGGTWWSARLSHQLAEFLLYDIGMGRSAMDYALLAKRVVLDSAPGYPTFDGDLGDWWAVVVPLSVVAGWWRPTIRRGLAASGLFFVAWAIGSQQIRLLLPVLGILSFACASAIVEAMGRVATRAVPAGVAALLALVPHHAEAWRAGLDVVTTDRADPTAFRPDPIYDAIRVLDPSARLLLLNTNEGYFVDREFLADSVYQASQIGKWLGWESSRERILRKLRAKRVTHVLVLTNGRKVHYPKALMEIVDAGRVVARSDAYTLVEIPRGPPG